MWLVPWLLYWAKAFVFTQLVEMPVYRFALKVSWARAFGASAITHPIVWVFVLCAPSEWSWLVRVLIAETFAVVAEAAYMARAVRWRRAAIGSIVANGASVLLGTLARRWVEI